MVENRTIGSATKEIKRVVGRAPLAFAQYTETAAAKKHNYRTHAYS